MHKLFLTILIASVAWVATAQRTTPQPASSGRTSTPTATLAPTPSAPSTARSTPAPQLTPKSGTTTTARPERTTTTKDRSTSTYAPRLAPKTTTTTTTTNSESAKDRNTAGSATARPARNTAAKKNTTSRYNGGGTARTVTTPAKKVEPVKPAKPVYVQWLTLEEAVEKCKIEKRKIFIDVFTDWCGWCKRMDETTFTDPTVAQYLNDHFYAVKFNAEQTGDILFHNKTYRFKNTGGRGYHELAAEWLNNRLSFPTSVFLDENMNLIQSLPNYQDGPKLEAILNYFGTDSHRTTPWEAYERNFNNQQ